MYYGSYSLPTYVTVWNADAFLLTTIVPVIIMILIDHAVLWYRLKLSPLKLLRRDSGKNRNERCIKPEDRNFFQVSPPGDLSEYQQLSGAVCGSCFCQSAAVFWNAPAVCSGSLSDGDPGEHAGKISVHTFSSGKCYPGNKADAMNSLLEYYTDTRTDNKDAEKFSAYSLNTMPDKYKK